MQRKAQGEPRMLQDFWAQTNKEGRKIKDTLNLSEVPIYVYARIEFKLMTQDGQITPISSQLLQLWWNKFQL